MKLRPRLFAAAALAMAASAYAGTISINFGAERTEAPGGSLATATESAGAIVVSSPNWNNASGASGTLNALKDGTGAVTGASVAWTSSNTYRSSSTDVSGNDNGILTKGYLDDSNAGYTATNCAERTAFFKAVSEGVKEFQAICVVGGKEGVLTEYAAPCGVCRQVMMEFCNPETFQIILAVDKEHYDIYTLKELLPLGFGPTNLA